MAKFWQRVIAIAEVAGGTLALGALIFAARAGAHKSAIVPGAVLDLLVIVAGVALWLRSGTGIVLSEIVLALQSVQVFTPWFAWQYVAGLALLVQLVGGEFHWSAGLLVRHTFFPEKESSGLGVGANFIALAGLAFLILSRKQGKAAQPRSTS